jgi:hypothetical protein
LAKKHLSQIFESGKLNPIFVRLHFWQAFPVELRLYLNGSASTIRRIGIKSSKEAESNKPRLNKVVAVVNIIIGTTTEIIEFTKDVLRYLPQFLHFFGECSSSKSKSIKPILAWHHGQLLSFIN